MDGQRQAWHGILTLQLHIRTYDAGWVCIRRRLTADRVGQGRAWHCYQCLRIEYSVGGSRVRQAIIDLGNHI